MLEQWRRHTRRALVCAGDFRRRSAPRSAATLKTGVAAAAASVLVLGGGGALSIALANQHHALRLVTCGGRFDAATHQYLSNIIVSAHLVSAHRGSSS